MADNTRKRSVLTLDAFQGIVEKYGCPMQAIAEIATATTTATDIRLSAWKELAGYGYAKVKAMEISGPDGGAIPMKLELVNQILGNMEKLKGG